MAETIYTIPVNEAFDASVAEKARCPFCRMYERLQENELELILGGSMMEPEVRIKTNKLGFCHRHYDKLFERKNRLGLGLILESHLNEVRAGMKGGVGDLLRGTGSAGTAKAQTVGESCYICGRIDFHFGKMLDNTVYLWETDGAFRKKLDALPMVCLPHFAAVSAVGKNKLGKKDYAKFYEALYTVTDGYFAGLCGDVSWFCKKFDYRYDEEPWGNSKDAVERAIRFLSSEDQ